MVDYDKSTGSSGAMRIRDLGSTVEFWITSGNSVTWNEFLPYGWTVNGSTGSSTYNYQPNTGWEKLKSFTVSYSQTVTFRLFDSGTSGFGGPTTHSVYIDRATAPDPPTQPNISNIQSSSVYVTFSDGDNNGASIDSRQIGYGTSSSTPSNTVSSDKSTTISGLSAGTRYYFWARTHNSKGWSSWSARATAVTLDVPDPPSTPLLSEVSPTSVRLEWSPNASNGAPITAYEVGYGTSPSAPSQSISATSPKTVTGLIPGTTYYFWVRAQNSVGWSAYSASANVMTIAGVRIKVNGVWVIAVPYVRVSGEWKLARPYVRVLGVWKETI